MEELLEFYAYAEAVRELHNKLGPNALDDSQYVAATIAYANKACEFFARLCQDAEVDPLVPDSAKCEEVICEYRKRGAHALADLCERQRP